MEIKSRTASEILLEMEQKILMLTKAVAVIDSNQKLMLNKLSDIYKVEARSISVPQAPVVVSMKPSIEVASQPRQPSRQASAVTVSQPLLEKPSPLPEASKTGSKIPVIQRVVDVNGKDVYMTDISVREKDTSVQVHTGKTNTTGKWSAYLPVGSYIVRLAKTNKDTMELMEFFEEFEITNQMKTLSLPNFYLKK